MKNSTFFKLTEISDIHFGNGRVSPERCLQHLHDYLYPKLTSIDLLVINGDTFDTLLNMNSSAGFCVATFIDDITTLAVRNKFFVRIVRGTFSHDRHQNRFFTVHDRGSLVLKGRQQIAVQDRMSIEEFPNGPTVLYSPDDQPHQDLTQAMIDLIESFKLKQVDLVFSHGYFDHLIPKEMARVPHNTVFWDRLKPYVKGLVFNGHVHHRGVRDRVISSGSFERFDHTVVEPVGFWTASCENGKWSYEFVENTDAIPFRTFTRGMYFSDEALRDEIVRFIKHQLEIGYDPQAPIYIRVLGRDTGLSSVIQGEYPNVVWTTKSDSAKQTFDEEVRTDCDELPAITEENLADLVHAGLGASSPLTLDDVKEILHDI